MSARIRALCAVALLYSGCSGAVGPFPCSDDAHCPSGDYCGSDGKCAPGPACTAPQTACHGRCVSTASDASNCGTCGNACTAPALGAPACSASQCGFTCGAPAVRVDQACLLPPSAATAVQLAGEAQAIRLSWTPGTNAASTTVRRATVAGGPYTDVATSASTPYVDSGLAAGTLYFYVLRSVNPAGTADAAEASAETLSPLPTAVGTQGLSAAIRISWSASAGASGYRVSQSASAAGPFVALADAAQPQGTATTTVSSGLGDGATFYYSVEALNPSGTSGPTLPVAGTTLPAQPANLVALKTSPVQLAWDSVASATSYALLRASRSGVALSPVATVQAQAGAKQQTQDTTAPLASDLYYEVQAINGGGPGPLSATLNVQTAPAVPQNFTAAAVDEVTVALSWDISPGAASYTVSRTGADGSTPSFSVPAPSGSPPRVTSTDATLWPGFSGTWTVVAVGAVATSAASLPAPAQTPFPAPTGLKVTSQTDQCIKLTAVRDPYATHYQLLRSSGGAQVTLPRISNPASGATVSFNDCGGLAPATAYAYALQALVVNGKDNPQSPPSAPLATSTFFSAPRGLAVAPVGGDNSSLSLSWTNVPGATAYHVLRSLQQGAETLVGTAPDPKGTSPYTVTYQDYVGTEGTKFYYRVQAVAGAIGGVATTSVPGVTGLDAPALNTSLNDTTQITLNLYRVPGATTLHVYRSTSVGTETEVTPAIAAITSDNNTGTFKYVAQPSASGTDYFQFAWGTGGALGPRSAEIAIPVPTAVPGSTSQLRAAACSKQVTLNWSPVPNAASYTVLRGPNATSLTAFTPPVSTTARAFTDTTVTSGFTYAYGVQAVNTFGAGPAATISNVTTAAPGSGTWGVCGQRQINQILDSGGDVAVPESRTNYVAAFVTPTMAAPNPPNLTALTSPDGYWTLAGLTATNTSYYYLRTSARLFPLPNNTPSIDLSTDSYGRSNPPFLGGDALLDVAAVNLGAWQPGDYLELAIPNTGGIYFNAELSPGAPLPGDKALSHLMLNLYTGVGTQNTASDPVYLSHYTQAVSTTGVPYTALTEQTLLTPFTPLEGQIVQTSGSFAVQTPDAHGVSGVVLRSKFRALAPQINPAALPTGENLFVDAPPEGKITFQGAPDLLSTNLPAGASDLDLGTMSFANPFPATYLPRANLYSNWTINYDLGLSSPAQLFLTNSVSEPLSTFLSDAAAGGIAPKIGPPGSPTINGSDLGTPQTGVGVTPTLHWTAPQLGTPNFYVVYVYTLGDDGTGNGFAGLYGGLINVPGTQLTTQVPARPGLIPGSSYAIEICAVIEPNRNLTVAPFKSRGPLQSFGCYASAIVKP